jgi:hypothetical protein
LDAYKKGQMSVWGARKVDDDGRGIAAFLTLVVYAPAMAQQVVAVYFEDLGYGSSMSCVFAFDSVTGAPIELCTPWSPQFAEAGSPFTWQVSGHFVMLKFATFTDYLQITGYDSRYDLLYFTRPPYYWAVCRSSYIPKAIPTERRELLYFARI